MKTQKNWYRILWLSAAVAAAGIYLTWQMHPEVVGIVETRVHRVGAQDSGLLQQMLVDVGSPVRRGQRLATLDLGDLETERAQLEGQLATLEQIIEADRGRHGLELDLLGERLAAGSSERATRRAELEAKRAELAALVEETERLRRAAEAGLGQARQLPDLVIRRESLERYVRTLAGGLGAPAAPRTGARATDDDALLTSLLGDRLEQRAALQERLAALRHREALRQIVAPCDGWVVELLARPGDTVQAFNPVIGVAEQRPGYVDLFLPEAQALPALPGTTVELTSKRPGVPAGHGVVRFVYPGYDAVPERLTFGGQPGWALRLRVELEPGHAFLPGESLRAHLSEGSSAVVTAGSPSAETPLLATPAPERAQP